MTTVGFWKQIFAALFYQASCCPLSPGTRHLLLSRGFVWAMKVVLLSPEVCRLLPKCLGHGHRQAAVAHRAPHRDCHSFPAEPGQKQKLAMCSSNTILFPVVWRLCLVAIYYTTYQNPQSMFKFCLPKVDNWCHERKYRKQCENMGGGGPISLIQQVGSS